MRRHKGKHLPTKLVMVRAAGEVAETDTMLDQVKGLQARAYAVLDKAEEAGELSTALSAVREARGNLELLAKLLGEFDERPVVNFNVSPEWLELRAVIVTTGRAATHDTRPSTTPWRTAGTSSPRQIVTLPSWRQRTGIREKGGAA